MTERRGFPALQPRQRTGHDLVIPASLESRRRRQRVVQRAPQETRISNPQRVNGNVGTASFLASRWPAREFAREPSGHLRRGSYIRMRSALLHSTGTTSAGRTGKRRLNGILDCARRALRSPTESGGRRGNRIEFWRGTPSTELLFDPRPPADKTLRHRTHADGARCRQTPRRGPSCGLKNSTPGIKILGIKTPRD